MRVPKHPQSKRFRTLAKNLKIRAVDKEPVPLASRDLTQDAKLSHALERLCHSWCGHSDPLSCVGNRNNRVALHMLEHAQNGRCGSPQRFNLPLMLFEERHCTARGACG